MSDLPTGTVTFLFTDIEGSTRLLHELGAEAYDDALAEHRRILREALAGRGGVEVDTEGDAFFVAFPAAPDAVAAAAAAQEALAAGPIRVRMGLHTGRPHMGREGYIGEDVHRGARIAASAHGRQIVLSKETRDLLEDAFVLTDLGEHRVKDFAESVWIYQLGKERFPPLKTISNTNLPRPASSFVGREREVAEIGALLRDGTRLLTLTGPGGTGKTRLAIESAAELVPAFKNGVFWVDLAAIRDPELVSDTIASVLGAKDTLREHIGDKELLLLLDNLEHVITVAPGLATLVESCPNLKLLVTSRELLRVRGEREYGVPPLAPSDAVTLFSDRANLAPDEAIADLCRRLDDLPLAVELAAARATVLSPAQITERLAKRLDLLRAGRDADARQATLRATIDWSHDLLSHDEQRLFARLSAFRGGFTLEAAEAVCEADLDVLQSLVEKSLVRRADKRFAMLETIREFAAERLETSGEANDTRTLHARFFLELAEAADPHLLGGDSTMWLDRLDPEHDNLRAAMDHFEAAGEGELVLRLAGSLWGFWYIKGHYVEGGRRIEAALEADQTPTPARARALIGASAMLGLLGDLERARRRAEDALELNRRLGDTLGIARSTFALGHAAKDVRDWPAAHGYFEDSLRAFKDLGDDHRVMVATDLLAYTSYQLGDRERAWKLGQQNLRQARATGDEEMEATALGALGMYAVMDGRVDEALPLLAQAMRLWRTRGISDFDEVELDMSSVARAAALRGRPDVAAKLIAAMTAANQVIGAVEPVYVADLNAGTTPLVRERLDDAAFAAAWEEGQKLTWEDAIALALDEARDA